eukprot:bmy_05093T0
MCHCHHEVTPEGVPTHHRGASAQSVGRELLRTGSGHREHAPSPAQSHRALLDTSLRLQDRGWLPSGLRQPLVSPESGGGTSPGRKTRRKGLCRRAQVCHPQHGPQKPPASHTRGCGCTLAGAPPWGVTPRAWALRPRLCLRWHRTGPWEHASRPVLSRFPSKPRGPSCHIFCCPPLGLPLTAQGEASCWGRGRPPSRPSPSGCTGPPDFRKAKSQSSGS